MCIDYLFRSTTYLLATIILFIVLLHFFQEKKWDTKKCFSPNSNGTSQTVIN